MVKKVDLGHLKIKENNLLLKSNIDKFNFIPIQKLQFLNKCSTAVIIHIFFTTDPKNYLDHLILKYSL